MDSNIKELNNLQENEMNAILALYNLVNGEIVRYRNLEWTITGYVVILLAFIADIRQDINDYQSFAIFTILLILIIGIWQLHFIHTKLTEQRNRQKDLEIGLGFFEKSKYIKDDTLLPIELTEKRVYWDAKKHLIPWYGIMILTANYALLSIDKNIFRTMTIGILNMSTGNLINSFGLILDILGVLLLFFFGLAPSHKPKR